MDRNICYRCAAPATTKEHVPPKCLFPVAKDVSGQDYRKELITVPSCQKHNCDKSHDDEFLMVSIAGIVGNNSIGYMHKMGKVNRAIKRSSEKLLESAFTKKKKYLLKNGKNKYLEIIWGTPDLDRLNQCFSNIAYGLHFKHFTKVFSGRTRVLLGYLNSKNQNHNSFVNFIKDKTEIEVKNQKKFGSNPDIFHYQFTKPDEFGVFLVRLCFYGGIVIYVSFIPSEAKIPHHLAFELINSGIETRIELGEKTYFLNQKII